MKTIKFLKLIMIAIVTLTVTSCVDSDEYDVPPVAQQIEPNVTVNSSINAVKEAWNQNILSNGDAIYTFEESNNDGSNNIYLEGYVVSSDYAGNFYKSLIIQDAAENPTNGIEILIDKTSLFESYEVGRKVYVKLNGLSVSYDDGDDNFPLGEDNPANFNNEDTNPGRYRLGYLDGNEVDDIPSFLYTEHVLRSTMVSTIIPKVITTVDFTQDNINTFVQIQDMQFGIGELEKTYAGETDDQFDGFRELFNCTEESTTMLQTSTFSDFKSFVLPSEVGSINAVLAKDFRADFFVLIVNDPTYIDFTSTERCDPIILDCGIASSQGTMNLFNDDFETQTPFSLITGNGWTNYIETGSEGWEAYTSGGTNSSLGVSARMSAYNSNDNDNIGWLITPSIDFDAQNGETLKFRTSNSFSDDSKMDLLFSTDWDGIPANITTATWGVLPAAYIVQDNDFYGSWFDSGIVDLSCATGNMYIAFKYSGGDRNDFTGTYELDEISIDYTP